ncbi:putative hydrolase or acyltransferase of alpha/beta superfamily [Beggiatoa alba B18LD]|uniref:Putative hydrolase or acyltransferase of alpha/beta superfamily n=1 Tax=Beggiatoa alba B18LD TaxID=395493 RepID=I3CK21_9GAMM|nr:alpha/beta hydrolase [Beggiatoa alba]EIJ43964.1 putative hydrolase or acyltransferase of alpha/beta superfamily [Beggiatoa alba B18LD]
MECIINGQPTFIAIQSSINPHAHTIIFIHGAAMDHSIWTLPRRYFTRHGYNALAIDLPAHGRSEGQALTCIEAQADWLITCLDELGLKKATFIGHSMGSLIALDLAGRYPNRVDALALLGTAIPMPVSDTLLQAAEKNQHDAYDLINLFGHCRRSQLGGNAISGMWSIGSTVRLLERARPHVLHTDFLACHHYHTGLEQAQRVTCPTLLIVGKQDSMTSPKAAQTLAKYIPQAQIVLVDNCGHFMLSEQPEAVLLALQTMMSKIVCT